MFPKHTYLSIISLIILLFVLGIGTVYLKEGYHDYISTILEGKGYSLPSDIEDLMKKIQCQDGTLKYDHVDADCSKPIQKDISTPLGQPEACTITKHSDGTKTDSCRKISPALFCEERYLRCNTHHTRELEPGKTCKYPNECISRNCNNNVCVGDIPISSDTQTSASNGTTTNNAKKTCPGTTQPTGSAQGELNAGTDFFAQFKPLIIQDIKDVMRTELNDYKNQQNQYSTNYECLGPNESCC